MVCRCENLRSNIWDLSSVSALNINDFLNSQFPEIKGLLNMITLKSWILSLEVLERVAMVGPFAGMISPITPGQLSVESLDWSEF